MADRAGKATRSKTVPSVKGAGTKTELAAIPLPEAPGSECRPTDIFGSLTSRTGA